MSNSGLAALDAFGAVIGLLGRILLVAAVAAVAVAIIHLTEPLSVGSRTLALSGHNDCFW